MTIADYQDAYRLWQATPGMGLRILDDSQTGIARYLDRNPKSCFVAIIDDEIVGTILCGQIGRASCRERV